MIDLIQTPFNPSFKKFVEDIVTDGFICSPYITDRPIKMLVETVAKKKLKNDIKINVLTDISYHTLVHGGTETSALLYLLENHRNVCVTYLPNIHAKVYIANQSSAIITSANFTHGGGKTNFEYGIRISDHAIVQKIQNDMDEYRKLGEQITQDELETIHTQVEETKKTIRSEKNEIAKAINKMRSKGQQREIENNLIRARTKNKTTHTIFSETLLYLLSKQPSKTKVLNALVSSIHPDLCDSDVDRVIDGKHYGKLWKHQVRNAQVSLKRSDLIFYDKKEKLWRKTNE